MKNLLIILAIFIGLASFSQETYINLDEKDVSSVITDTLEAKKLKIDLIAPNDSTHVTVQSGLTIDDSLSINGSDYVDGIIDISTIVLPANSATAAKDI